MYFEGWRIKAGDKLAVKYNGLVHKSEIANQFVKDPRKFLAVGEVHEFLILLIDKNRNRIQLSLKQVPKKTT